MNFAISCIRQPPYNTILRKNPLCRTLLDKPLALACFNRKLSQFFDKYTLKNNAQINIKTNRNYSDNKDSSLVEKSSKKSSEISTTLRETVKETTKTTFSTLIIIAGVGVTGLLFYAVFRELFSSKSPNTIYTKAFEKCSQDVRIKDTLGEPIKGHGEISSRGRRRHVSHVSYIKDNVEHMRMKFYLKGARKNGTVHLEVIENSSGNYDYRYLFVQMDEWPHKVIVLEDNRHGKVSVPTDIQTPLDVDSVSTFKYE